MHVLWSRSYMTIWTEYRNLATPIFFCKIYGYMLNQWPCDFHISFPTHPLWWRWSHFICWQATKGWYNMCSAFFLWSEILLTVFHCGEAIFQFSICEKRYKQARQTQGLLLLVFSFWSQPLSADAQLRGSAPVSFHLCSRYTAIFGFSLLSQACFNTSGGNLLKDQLPSNYD